MHGQKNIKLGKFVFVCVCVCVCVCVFGIFGHKWEEMAGDRFA